jgi:tellurite resistance protein TerC
MADAPGEREQGAPDTARVGWISYAFARRVVVAVVGGTLLALGAVLLLVPGPGVLVVSMGLGVLAIEFAWARRWLRRLKERAARLVAPSDPTISRN